MATVPMPMTNQEMPHAGDPEGSKGRRYLGDDSRWRVLIAWALHLSRSHHHYRSPMNETSCDYHTFSSTH